MEVGVRDTNKPHVRSAVVSIGSSKNVRAEALGIRFHLGRQPCLKASSRINPRPLRIIDGSSTWMPSKEVRCASDGDKSASCLRSERENEGLRHQLELWEKVRVGTRRFYLRRDRPTRLVCRAENRRSDPRLLQLLGK